jgi:hypothetical protein
VLLILIKPVSLLLLFRQTSLEFPPKKGDEGIATNTRLFSDNVINFMPHIKNWGE